MIDDDQDEGDDDDNDVIEGEEDDDNSVGSKDSDDTNLEDVEVESDDMECEIDEEFRKEIKLALGDAALPSSDVCHLHC